MAQASFIASASPPRLAWTQVSVLGLGTVATLAMVREQSEASLEAALWEAVRVGLVLWQDGACRFLHDRVQEAAYALITEGERAAVHLRIGRLLAAGRPPLPVTCTWIV